MQLYASSHQDGIDNKPNLGVAVQAGRLQQTMARSFHCAGLGVQNGITSTWLPILWPSARLHADNPWQAWAVKPMLIHVLGLQMRSGCFPHTLARAGTLCTSRGQVKHCCLAQDIECTRGMRMCSHPGCAALCLLRSQLPSLQVLCSQPQQPRQLA